jgi:DNA-directed RNA polymerase subunit RPC12/RpoP
MERHSRKTGNWFDTVILTVLHRPKNLLLSTRKRRTNAERSDIVSCPYCGSNQVHAAVVDPEPPIIVHHVCERCSKEWVE